MRATVFKPLSEYGKFDALLAMNSHQDWVKARDDIQQQHIGTSCALCLPVAVRLHENHNKGPYQIGGAQ